MDKPGNVDDIKCIPKYHGKNIICQINSLLTLFSIWVNNVRRTPVSIDVKLTGQVLPEKDPVLHLPVHPWSCSEAGPWR